MTTSRPAAIYARISNTAEDRDKVADQIGRCRRVAARRGYTIDENLIFQDDGISAFKGRDRPGWRALASAIETGRVSAVLATEEERFTRTVAEKVEFQAICAAAGVVWETERDGHVDPSHEAGEFLSTLRAALGKLESGRKGERQRARNLNDSSEGKPVATRRRYGYESDGRTPREAEAAQVRRMFAHVAAGGSLRFLLRAVEAEGVDPAPGKSWSTRRLRHILMNPHYAGTIRHLGREIPSTVVTPLVDPALAEEVRGLLDDPTRRTTPGSQPRHLASGIAVCGACGEGMYRQARAYRCRSGISHPAIRPDYLDGRIRSEVARAFLVTGGDLAPAQSSHDLPALRARHARNADAVNALLADRDEGLVSADVARARLLALRGERTEIEAALDEAHAERGVAGALAALAANLLPADVTSVPLGEWRAMEETVAVHFDALDIDARRELVRGLLRIQVDAERDPSRIRVEHLRAVSLNPGAEDYDAE